MSSPTTYPGVYIREIPSGVRPITGVATSITAFIGPTRQRAGRQGDHRSTGSPTSSGSSAGCARSSPLSFAVNSFFLNGGSQAVIVRRGGRQRRAGDDWPRPVDAGGQRAGQVGQPAHRRGHRHDPRLDPTVAWARGRGTCSTSRRSRTRRPGQPRSHGRSRRCSATSPSATALATSRTCSPRSRMLVRVVPAARRRNAHGPANPIAGQRTGAVRGAAGDARRRRQLPAELRHGAASARSTTPTCSTCSASRRRQPRRPRHPARRCTRRRCLLRRPTRRARSSTRRRP